MYENQIRNRIKTTNKRFPFRLKTGKIVLFFTINVNPKMLTLRKLNKQIRNIESYLLFLHANIP